MRVDIGTTTQKYRVIYADPPWKFSSKEAFEPRNGGSGFTPLEAVYPTMTTADLKALDVGRLANKDAALFLWATDAHLPDALELFKAWGFRYVTVAFVWAKKTVTGKSAANLAPWTLKNCELCLMGTRGRMVQYKAKVAAKLAEISNSAEAPDKLDTEGKTAIMGSAEATAAQMAAFCLSKNAEPRLPSCTVEELARLFLAEGEAEGVRGDVAFAQSLHETGFFKFGGIVQPGQNNYGGLGALNGNSAGQAASFPDPRSGVRAQIQHLKAYATTEPLVNECIDPRFSLVARGVAEFVEWLGAADNPSGRGWAVPGAGYGGKIVTLLGQIKATETEEPTPPTPPDDGYPEGTPAWQKEGFEALVERGIINSPEYWKTRFAQPMTAGEILAILGRI